MHKEVVDLVNEVKNEMHELIKSQKSDLLEVIEETQTVIINNTLAVNKMRNTIEKNSQKIFNIEFFIWKIWNFYNKKILIYRGLNNNRFHQKIIRE